MLLLKQGTKKFGEIADTVEVNAFDKLAAAFNDLAKSITTGVNKPFLVPVVEFLSQNPTALTGVTAFALSV